VFSMLPAFADFAKPTWKDFAYSALGTNVAIGAHMWFMADIIILTGVFALFCRFVPERFRETGLWMILLIAVMIEYTGVNYELFKTWHHDSQRPIGRIIPMVPYACLGLIAGCSRRRWSELPTAYRALLCIGGIAVALFLINFDVFVKPRGYSYTGLKMFAMAVALSSAAFFAPFDILQPCVGSIIVAISCYTMGIYFIHILVGRPLQNFVFAHTGLVQQSFLGSIAIFAVCWTVCWIVSLIPSKWARSLVE